MQMELNFKVFVKCQRISNPRYATQINPNPKVVPNIKRFIL